MVDTTGPTFTGPLVVSATPPDLVEVSWGAATDALSGLDHYFVRVGDSGGPACDPGDPDSEVLSAGATGYSTVVPPGEWTVDLCAVDVAGNGSLESLTAELLPPRILSLGSVRAPADDVIDFGEALPWGAAQLLVRFDETLDLDANDPAAFRLVLPGADEVFQTVDCSGPAADDALFGIDASTIDLSTDTIALAVGSGFALPAGDYRLVACAASIRDQTDKPLDGNGDLLGGAWPRPPMAPSPLRRRPSLPDRGARTPPPGRRA